MEWKFEVSIEDPVEDLVAQAHTTLPEDQRTLKVCLDKWLWAARFFKTRALARAAVENGEVLYNAERAKPNFLVEIGSKVDIQSGRLKKTVIVTGLSTRRHSIEKATQLFTETLNKSHVNNKFTQPPKERKGIRFLRHILARRSPSDQDAPALFS